MSTACTPEIPDAARYGDAAVEEAIAQCVRQYCTRALQDSLLAPAFRGVAGDIDEHIQRVIDFWSRVLLGTLRYSGHPYPVHRLLSVEPAHFDRWLTLFED
jgi:hemoglobin